MGKNKQYLLDTHILLWWLGADPKLPRAVRIILSDPHNKVYVSVASLWEVVIKQEKKKVKLSADLYGSVQVSNFTILSIELSHIREIETLPLYHNDPFDRMLIAQARKEKCALLTVDRKMEQYGVTLL